MAIKLSGMVSGLDTDAMIDELVKAYGTKKDNIYKEQKTLNYKQDAWKEMNTKIYSFFSGKLSNMRFSSAFNAKTSSVTGTKASVTASNTAVEGTQTLKIKQLAKTGYLTGAKLDGTIKKNSKMSELGITSDARINVNVDGKETAIDVTTDMTVEQFTTKLQSAGLNASFDETNQRFFVSSKISGASTDFSISGNDANGTAALKSMGLYTVSTADISTYKDYISKADSDADFIENSAKAEYLKGLSDARKKEINTANTDLNKKVSENTSKINDYKAETAFAKATDETKTKTIEGLEKSLETANKKVDEKQAALDKEEDVDKKEALQKELDSLIETRDKASDKLDRYKEIQSSVGSSNDSDFADKVAAFEADNQTQIDALEDDNKTLKDDIQANKDKITEINEQLKGSLADQEAYLAEDIDYSSKEYTDILEKYTDKYDNAKAMVDAYDEYQTLADKGDSATDSEKARMAELKTSLGLEESKTGAVRIEGSDAVIELNGAEFTSNTNNFAVNGLTITANNVTDPDETITINTAADVEGIYNAVKDFFKEYNELINEMDKQYNAASAGEYKPLTEDEESEMTDKQVEKWEKKLTDAALRKDSTLSSITSLMKTAMSQSFDVNGTSYNLSSFGIKTLSYFSAKDNEKGAYHIDGDKDDSATSGNTDKLREAIANDPETFVSFFTQLTTNVYNKLNSKMSGTSLSSAYTVYNDKYMTKQYNEYKDKLSSWDDKIDKIREKYEKQFAAMEKALSELNSKQSQFSSMLGQ